MLAIDAIQVHFLSFNFLCCLQFTVPYGVGATVRGYTLGGSDKSLTLAALTRMLGSGLPPTHISSLLQPPTPLFWKLSGFASILRLTLAPVWGSCLHLPPPRDDANGASSDVQVRVCFGFPDAYFWATIVHWMSLVFVINIATACSDGNVNNNFWSINIRIIAH